MAGKRCHTARDRPASVPLPIDMRRFAAKHADVALSANLASKDFVRIAVATMRIGMRRAKQTAVQQLKLLRGTWTAEPLRTPIFYQATTMCCEGQNRGRAFR